MNPPSGKRIERDRTPGQSGFHRVGPVLPAVALCFGLGVGSLVVGEWPGSWGGVALGLSVSLVGLTAFCLALPWRFLSAADRWLLWALFAASEIVIVEEGLSLFRALWPHTLLATEALLAGLVLLAMSGGGQNPLRALSQIGQNWPERLKNWWRSGWPARLFLGSAGLLLVWSWIQGAFRLFRAPDQWDSLTYHLSFPAVWLQWGSLTNLQTPYGDPAPAFFPLNAELLLYWGMAPLRSDFVARWANLPQWLILALATYRCAGRLGVRRLAAATGAILGTLYFYNAALFSNGNDITLAAAYMVALHFALLLREEPRWRNGVLVAMAYGLFLGTKYTAVPLLLPLLLVLAAVAYDSVRAARSPLPRVLSPRGGLIAATVLLAFLGTGGFAYVRNFEIMGNPVWPAQVSFLGIELLPGLFTKDTHKVPWELQYPYRLLPFLFSRPALLRNLGPQFPLLLAGSLFALGWAGRRRLQAWQGSRLRRSPPVHTSPRSPAADVPTPPASWTEGAVTLSPFLLYALFHFVFPRQEYRLMGPIVATLGVGLALSLNCLLPRAPRGSAGAISIAVMTVGFILYQCTHFRLPGNAPGWDEGGRIGAVMLVVWGVLGLGGCGLVGWGVRRRKRKGLDPQPGNGLRNGKRCLSPGLWWMWVWGVVGVGCAWPQADRIYTAVRYATWRQYHDGSFGPAWDWIERQTRTRPAVIGYVGNNVPYPLFGTHLRNRVLFVPRGPDPQYAYYDFRWRSGDPRFLPSRENWIKNLVYWRVNYLYVGVLYESERWPREVYWAEADPQRFTKVYEKGNVRIYEIEKSAAER